MSHNLKIVQDFPCNSGMNSSIAILDEYARRIEAMEKKIDIIYDRIQAIAMSVIIDFN